MSGTARVRPPGPGTPALVLDLLRHRDPTKTLRRLADDYPRIARVRLGLGHAYLLNHPDLVTSLLVAHGRDTRKGRLLEKIRIVLGDGLLTSEGEVHARQRRLIQPALHRERLAAYLGLMVEAAGEVSGGWRDGARVDLAREMSALTLTVVGRALFGHRLAAESAEIAACLDILLSGFGRHLLPGADVLQALPTPKNRRMRRAADRLDRLVRRLVAERRADQAVAERRADQAAAERADQAAHPEGRDLLSMLVRRMDPDRARDEAMTLLLAGHETTATALTWAWWLLDQHPQVRRWWYDEIDAESGVPDDPDRLPRTRALFAEAMRLYPPSWLLGRRLTEPVELDGFALPAGSLCATSQWAMHRDPRFWPEPEEFRPSRWLSAGASGWGVAGGEDAGGFDESAPGQPRGAYFPFGMGARACVGRSFAWAEGTLLLAALGRAWAPRVVPGHPVAVLPTITLRPRYGLPAVLSRR